MRVTGSRYRQSENRGKKRWNYKRGKRYEGCEEMEKL